MQASVLFHSPDAEKVEAQFHQFVRQADFPCVGAKSALAGRALETFVAHDLRSAWDDLAIHGRLCTFAASPPPPPPRLRSFAVLFPDTPKLGEETFEQALWDRLQSLRDKDAWLSYRPDSRVDANPGSPNFAFSVGGKGFFVVGLHPGGARLSRRAPVAALIFNPVEQFERLRHEGAYSRMSKVVRARDEALCGSANPMLADHGESSAARQFSGRIVDDAWKCPLRT